MSCEMKHIEYHLPEMIVTNEDMQKQFPRCNAKKIEEKIGIKQRHVVKESETALDLAYEVGGKILTLYNKNKIDFLILCTQSPDYYLPTSACILQDKLVLRKDIGAFDFNLGCSGFIYGLAISKGIINSRIANSVLLILSETYTKYLNKEDVSNRMIFGDAASAIIIEKSDKEHIYNFSLGTDGSGMNNLIVLNGGSRHSYDINAKVRIDQSGNKRTDNNLYMNGPEILNFTIEAVPKVINSVLEKNDINLNEIDYVIFHQANKYMLNYLRKKLRIPQEKFYNNMHEIGNTVSSTIPIALKKCLNNGSINIGDKILLCGFGVGYSWGATIIEI